jgi:hypothetical protein
MAIVLNSPLQCSIGIRDSIVITNSVRNDFHKEVYVNSFSNAFINTSFFGEDILYKHYNKTNWETYPVLFDDPTIDISYGDGASVLTKKLKIYTGICFLKYAVTKKDRCIVRGKKYYVDDCIEDGTGGIDIFLRVN